MDKKEIIEGLNAVYEEIDNSREYLVWLDQQTGDGDLGISMSDGFRAVKEYLSETEERNLSKLWNTCGNIFNEAASSSLGTIISFVFKGMSRSMNGLEYFNLKELATAMKCGAELAMSRAGSKLGEKTFFDSFIPGVNALKQFADDKIEAFTMAADAAQIGCETTKNMKAVWGRAACYGTESIGMLDGGAVVGSLIFKALANSAV